MISEREREPVGLWLDLADQERACSAGSTRRRDRGLQGAIAPRLLVARHGSRPMRSSGSTLLEPDHRRGTSASARWSKSCGAAARCPAHHGQSVGLPRGPALIGARRLPAPATLLDGAGAGDRAGVLGGPTRPCGLAPCAPIASAWSGSAPTAAPCWRSLAPTATTGPDGGTPCRQGEIRVLSLSSRSSADIGWRREEDRP
jgi:hypothetical protein